NLPRRFCSTTRQLVEIIHYHYLGSDSTPGCSDASSESDHVERSLARAHESLRLFTAHPVRHHHRLSAHILESVLLHLGDYPVDRLFDTCSSSQASAAFVRK